MLVDARTLPDRTTIESDIAIIGGGPAGITLARALSGSRINVCMVESGGLEFDAKVQALYAGENAGIEYPLSGSRLRYLGGSSNHWGGFCRPLDPIDFERREWVPHSGWPFGYQEVAPYYPAAAEIVEVSPGRYYDVKYWQQVLGDKLLDLTTRRMHIQFVHYSPPTRFGKRYREDLEKTRNIQVLLNANVVNIEASEASRSIDHLAVRTLSGLAHKVKARLYVLATGGLENARLLLLSNNVATAGLGNQHDLVGRYFMDHPHVGGFGEIVIADINRLPPIYREKVYVDGRYASAAFNPSEPFLRRQKLLNATFMMGVAGKYHADALPASDRDGGVTHADMLMAARPFITASGKPVNTDGPGFIGAWLGLGCAGEQSPNPASRVTLATERDVLGLPKIKLDWRLTAQDRRSLVTHMRSLALEFGALNIGRLVLRVADDGIWPEHVEGGCHHMGTTRMSDDPRRGVVDRNGKVHGIDNLYVAGSSVFPTSGSANPTLTIVALTLRLGDHLKGRLL